MNQTKPLMLGAAFICLALSSSVYSQNRNPVPDYPGSPKPGDELRPDSIRERQFRMSQLEKEAANQPMSPEEEKLAMTQIAEDFREIQVINNKMMASTVRASQLNYVSIASTLTEIRERALRLKTNLGLVNEPLPKKEKWQPAADGSELKKSLTTLDKSIMSFIESPIFRTPGVVDVEDSKKAGRNLENIIEWSALIKKDTERLKKNSNP